MERISWSELSVVAMPSTSPLGGCVFKQCSAVQVLSLGPLGKTVNALEWHMCLRSGLC